MKLKSKLVLEATLIALFTVTVMTAAVNYILTRQNAESSNGVVKKSFHVITDHLSEKRSALLENARQFTSTETVKSSLKFLSDYKTETDSMTSRPA